VFVPAKSLRHLYPANCFVEGLALCRGVKRFVDLPPKEVSSSG
jgi:hypothetical protein